MAEHKTLERRDFLKIADGAGVIVSVMKARTICICFQT